MPSWDELRRQTRQAVHATFAFPAIYTPPGGGVPVEINARLHTRVVRFGDLDREGFAQVIEDVNRVVIDLAEVSPVSRAQLDFGDGRVYSIVNVIDRPGEPVVECEVKPV